MASNQRYGAYLTTGQVTQQKIDSFRGFLRGIRLRFGIVDINKADKNYIYDVISTAVALAVPNKLSILFQMWRNPIEQVPGYWMKPPFNVPLVITDDDRLTQYAYYLDTTFRTLCDNADINVSLWLKSLTDEEKKTIIGWMGNFGTTGDYYGYKGKPKEDKYDIENDVWIDYVEIEAKKLIDLNKINNPWLEIALNPNNAAEDWDKFIAMGVRLLKTGELGHGYSQSGEGTFFRRTLGLLAIDKDYDFYSESEGMQTDPSYTPQDFLPLVVSFVTAGAKILSVAATDNVADISLAFLNLYAGSDEGGYSYMKDAIDYADEKRFDPALYGPVIDPARLNSYNQQVQRINNDPDAGAAFKGERLSKLLESYLNLIRKGKIQAEYKERGYVFNEASIHENDGNVDLWPGNYEMRLHMKVFEGFGYNRLGDNKAAFGRYMRGIKYAAWDYDYENITEIKITYFDSKAAFNVRAMHENGEPLVATISCKNTQKWVQQTFTVAGFVPKGINGNDVVINSIRGTCLLQIIEVK